MEEDGGLKPIHLILDIAENKRSLGGEENQDVAEKGASLKAADEEGGGDEGEVVVANEGRRLTTTPPPGVIPVDDPSLFDKLFITFCACGAQLSLNLSMRVLGPSLLDLAELYGVHTSAIVKTLGMRAPGYVAGALLAGFVYKKVNRVVILSTFLFCLGLTLLFIPNLPSVNYFYPLMVVQGVSLGLVDPGSSTQAMDAWGAKSGPFLQVVYAGYGMGALLAPQIARPFLSETRRRLMDEAIHPLPETTRGRLVRRETDEIDNDSNLISGNNITMSQQWDHQHIQDVGHEIWDLISHGLTPLWKRLVHEHGHQADNSTAARPKRQIATVDQIQLPYLAEDNRIANAFYVACGIDIFFAAAFFAFFIFRPYVRFTESLPKKTSFEVSQVESEGASAGKKLKYRFLSDNLVDPRVDQDEGGWDLKNGKRWGLLCLAGLLLFLLVGTQILVSMTLVSFLVMNPRISMSRRQAADVDTIFWATFTLARMVTVVIAWFLTSHDIAVFCLFVILASSTMLSIFPNVGLEWLSKSSGQSGTRMLFQGLILTWAAGDAPMAGALFTLLKYFTVVSHEEASFLFAIMGLADLVPFFLGGWIIEPDPTREAFLYCLTGMTVVIIISYISLYCYGHYVMGIMPNADVPKRRLPCKRSAE